MQVIAYHGSPHRFENFSFEKIGTEGGTTGAGIGLYFTTDKVDALTYGEILYECRLELKANIDNDKVSFSPTQLRAILTSSGFYPKEYKGPIKDKIVEKLIRTCVSDTDIIWNVAKEKFSDKLELFLNILCKYGFTHTLDLDSPDNITIQHYIVYDLNAIKIIKISELDEM